MAITDNTSWTSTIYGVLFHPDEPLIWLLSCDKGWTLPTAIVDKPVWIRPTHKIGETMGNSIGIPVIFMQCVSFERNRDEHQEESVFVLHSRRGGLPCFYTAGQWVSRTDLSSSDYVNVPHRKLLQDILREVEKALVPRERPSWARSDWFDEATNWISLQLS